MPLPWSAELAGRIDEHVISSGLLRGNPLGDPHERPLLVYTPPGYDAADRRYPAVYVIQGYTGHVAMWRGRSPFRQPFPETADAMFARAEAPPAIVVYVDAWTAYGGSQFVDSPGTGKYHSYLCDEVVPWVDARYRTIPDAAHRAIAGKSSGGFGAMITPMLRPDLFGALATHAGDALYEYCYVPAFPQAVRELRGYDGDIFRWWADFRSRVAFTKPEDMNLVGLLGVAACFSAGPDGTPELPFDPHSGVLRPDVWQRWLDWDPVRMVPRYAGALRSLRGIWIDAGTRDDFYLDVGASAFRAALASAGVADEAIHYELFDATHAAIDYRYPLSLAWLCRRMTPLPALHLGWPRVPRAAAHRGVGGDHQGPGQVVADPLPVARAQDDDEADQAGKRPCVGDGVQDEADPADGQLRHVRGAAALADDAQPQQLHPQRLPLLAVGEEDPVQEPDQREYDEGDNSTENVNERAVASIERYRHERGDEAHEEGVDQVLHDPAPRHFDLGPRYLRRRSLLVCRVCRITAVTAVTAWGLAARLRGDRLSVGVAPSCSWLGTPPCGGAPG